MTKKVKILLGILAIVVVIAGAGLLSSQSGLFKGMIFLKNTNQKTTNQRIIRDLPKIDQKNTDLKIQKPQVTTSQRATTDSDIKIIKNDTILDPKISETICLNELILSSKSPNNPYSITDIVLGYTFKWNKNCKYSFNIIKDNTKITVICSPEEIKKGLDGYRTYISCQPEGEDGGIDIYKDSYPEIKPPEAAMINYNRQALIIDETGNSFENPQSTAFTSNQYEIYSIPR